MFAYIGNDIQNADGSELTIADVNKNYKPALKYLGVRSIAENTDVLFRIPFFASMPGPHTASDERMPPS